MPQSGVRYVVTLQDLTAPAFNTMNANANKTEASIINLQNSLKGLGSAFALNFGVSAIKEAVKEYAQYEQSLIRIKNVSESVTEGMKNQNFILAEAKKFKIDIAEATDSFGEFLTMIRGAHIASSDVRKLHDELLLIGKVTALPQSQMDASVRNLGKLLEEGALEGRHVRPLMYQLSGLAPYVASQLNMTTQAFEKFLSSGKMTKAAIDSRILLKAISEYATDLAPKLGESLNSTQSSLNELNNGFFEAKNSLVEGFKPELMSLITMLKDGATYIKENKDELVALGKTALALGEIYLKYKLAVGAVNLVNATYRSFMLGYHSLATQEIIDTERKSIAIGLQTQAINKMTIALERLVYVQAKANNMPMLAEMSARSAAMSELSSIYSARAGTISGLGAQGIPLANAGVKVGVIASITSVVTAVMAELPLIIGAVMASDYIASLLPKNPINNQGWDLKKISESMINPETKAGLAMSLMSLFRDKPNPMIGEGTSIGKWNGYWFDEEKGADGKVKGKGKSATDSSKLGFTKDEVKGNRPQTYNVYIKEMNGNKDCKFELQSLDKMDASAFGRRMADILLSVTNDTQLRNGN